MSVVSCPSCGAAWNTKLNNSCACGASIKPTLPSPAPVKGVLTVRKFMLKKFPTNKWMDCPIPTIHWDTIQEYAEAFHQSLLSQEDAAEFLDWVAKEDYKPGSQNKHWYKWIGMDCEEVPYTTAELYTIFKSQSK